MIGHNNIQGLLGDMSVNVMHVGGIMPDKHRIIPDFLYKTLDGDAKAHCEVYTGENFDKTLNALLRNKIQAYFITLNKKGAPLDFAGGAIQYPSVFTKWDGKSFVHYPAVYSEDTFVSKEKSKLFRQLTTGSGYPRGLGLGTYFVCERIRQDALSNDGPLPFGQPASCRIGEHALGNAPILAIYKKLNASWEQDPEQTVMQFDDASSCLKRNGKKVPVETSSLSTVQDNQEEGHDNVFLVNWSSEDGLHKICASFTQGIASFSGTPIIRVQFTANGILNTSSNDLQDVVSALISVGGQEALRRDWLSNMNDLMSSMRLHALYEPKIVGALKELGAGARFLGPRPMQPTVMEFARLPSKFFARPLPQPTAFYEMARNARSAAILASQNLVEPENQWDAYCVA